MQYNYFINCSSCHTFSPPLLFPVSFSSCLSCPSFIFLCSLRALYNVFWLYSTPLQLLSNSIPLPYPPNFMFFKRKSFKTKLRCSNIFGCVVCHQKLQDYLDSYSRKEDRLSLSQNLPTVCSTPLSTVGFVLA